MSYDYVFIVLDVKKNIKGVFKKRARAENVVPEGLKNFRIQKSINTWQYGNLPECRWTKLEIKVNDTSDLG